MALGGQARARLAARLRLPTSPSTLLRLVRVAPVPHTSALQAVGVEEWTWRRGHRYGTLLIDLVTHRVVDLLPYRSVQTVAAWLAQHPTIVSSVAIGVRSMRTAFDRRPEGGAGGRSVSSRPHPSPGA